MKTTIPVRQASPLINGCRVWWRILPILLHLVLASILCQTASAGETQQLIPIHVKPGTNLIHLARDYCFTRNAWKEIASVNNLGPPYIILKNTTIQVPESLLITQQLTAIVASVHGDVLLMNRDGTTRKLQNNDRLHPGQTIAAGEDGHAHLLFPDQKYTRIEPNTKLTLTYLFSLTDGSVKSEFFVDKGRILHTIKQKLKQNETFRTRTPVSLTGIRGTEFRVKMHEETNLVETLSGAVQVDAAGKKLVLPPGQGTSVAHGSAPAPPKPLPSSPASPVLEPVYRTLPIRLVAPDHDSAVKLLLRVSADTQGRQIFLEQTAAPGTSFPLTDLEDGSYSAFLTAIDAKQFESLPTGPIPLVIRTIPGAPIITAPQNRTTIWNGSVRIGWLASTTAVSYKAQLAADPEFNTILHQETSKQTSITFSELQPGSYHFRVQAIAEDGFVSLFSVPLTWDCIEPPAMQDIDTSDTENITLQWSAMAAAGTYELEIARDEAFTKIVLSVSDLHDPSYPLEAPLSFGTYYVHVRGKINDGTIGPWAPPQIMTIPAEPPGVAFWITLISFIGLIIL